MARLKSARGREAAAVPAESAVPLARTTAAAPPQAPVRVTTAPGRDPGEPSEAAQALSRAEAVLDDVEGLLRAAGVTLGPALLRATHTAAWERSLQALGGAVMQAAADGSLSLSADLAALAHTAEELRLPQGTDMDAPLPGTPHPAR